MRTIPGKNYIKLDLRNGIRNHIPHPKHCTHPTQSHIRTHTHALCSLCVRSAWLMLFWFLLSLHFVRECPWWIILNVLLNTITIQYNTRYCVDVCARVHFRLPVSERLQQRTERHHVPLRRCVVLQPSRSNARCELQLNISSPEERRRRRRRLAYSICGAAHQHCQRYHLTKPHPPIS